MFILILRLPIGYGFMCGGVLPSYLKAQRDISWQYTGRVHHLRVTLMLRKKVIRPLWFDHRLQIGRFLNVQLGGTYQLNFSVQVEYRQPINISISFYTPNLNDGFSGKHTKSRYNLRGWSCPKFHMITFFQIWRIRFYLFENS